MWPFDRSCNGSSWEAILRDCDFELARAEFSGFFQMMNREAESNPNQGSGSTFNGSTRTAC